MYQKEIKEIQKELNKIPWYTFSKAKREHRAQLKESLKQLRILIGELD